MRPGPWLFSLLCSVLRRAPWLPGRWRVVPWALRTIRRVGHELPERTVRTSHGFLFRCNPGDWVGQHVYVTGTWEETTTNLVPALLPAGTIGVDVGANVGYFTLLMARSAGPTGRVHAFEPMPAALERLRGHVAINQLGNVTVHAAAVADQSGHASLFLGPPDHTSVSSLHARPDGVSVDVPCTTLDEMFPDQPVQLLKIDAEGFEPQVLAGARGLLSRGVPYVIAEVSEPGWPSALLELGYSMHRIGWDGLWPVADPRAPGLPPQFNALFASRPLPDAVSALVLAPGSRPSP